MRIDLREPCKECPFRRSSMPGWLGPWTPEDMVWELNANEFPCHKTIKRGGQSIADASLQSCAGAAQFLNNRVKLGRAPLLAAHQGTLCEHRAPGVHPDVFNTPDELITHHRSLGLVSGEL